MEQGYRQEYQWYLIGCRQTGQEPLDEVAFALRWQEFETHAEQLKSAETEGQVEDLPSAIRTRMQQSIQKDPFVKAILLGMNSSG